MSDPDQKSSGLKTVKQAFEIIEYIKTNEGIGVAEIAEQFALPKSTAHGYLDTLYKMEYLTKKNGEYYLGLRFLNIGGYAANQEVYQMIRPKVKELADETNERAHFIVEEFGRGIYVHIETGSGAVETDVRLGKIASLHTISAGKAILACLSEERVQAIIRKHGLPACTANTITNLDILFEEIKTIRERGYAFNNSERIKGMRAVGVPIRDNENVIGALSVSGPAHRLKGKRYEEEIPNLLLGTANELELNIIYN